MRNMRISFEALKRITFFRRTSLVNYILRLNKKHFHSYSDMDCIRAETLHDIRSVDIC